MMRLLLLSVTLLSSLLFLANAHGVMCTPRQRGASREGRCGSTIPHPSNYVQDSCPHCLNGGGVGNVKMHLPPGGWKVYDPITNYLGSATRAGLCGDPKGRNQHMIGGQFMPYPKVPFVATYSKGQVVDMMIEIDTNHNGYFEFFICNLDACGTRDIDGSCFQNGHCKRLNRVPHPDCQDPNVDTHFDCGPIDAQYPSRWYVPCRKTGHVGQHLVGGETGHMKLKLPNDLVCEHCVVQWYWATANSCVPPAFLRYFTDYNNPFGTTCASDGGGLGAHSKGLAACSGVDRVPEEFWTCADVKIKDRSGSTSPPTPSPTSTQSAVARTTPPATTAMTPTPSNTPSKSPSVTPVSTSVPPTTRPTEPPVSPSADPTPTGTMPVNPTVRPCPDNVCLPRSHAGDLCKFKSHCEVVRCNTRGRVKKFRCQAKNAPSPTPSSVSCPAFACQKRKKARNTCRGLLGCKIVECFGVNGNSSKKGYACVRK